MAKRVLAFAYGIVAYLVFVVTVLYGIGFVGNILVPKGIDDGLFVPPAVALLIDGSLIAVFGLQHSLMARAAFKQRSVQLIPEPIERSTFVLFASLSLLLLFWQWRPLLAPIWNFPMGVINVTLTGLFWIGWLVLVVSTFLINHFDQFGLRQVTLYLRGIDYTPVEFKQRALYRVVRHPQMLGFLIAFWATPRMTVGHLVFSGGMTALILIGITLEEKDLLKAYGETYQHYRQQVSMLIPLPRKK